MIPRIIAMLRYLINVLAGAYLVCSLYIYVSSEGAPMISRNDLSMSLRLDRRIHRIHPVNISQRQVIRRLAPHTLRTDASNIGLQRI